jgi:hypothetical protein
MGRTVRRRDRPAAAAKKWGLPVLWVWLGPAEQAAPVVTVVHVHCHLHLAPGQDVGDVIAALPPGNSVSALTE